jgi:pilus assembly protein CpaB
MNRKLILVGAIAILAFGATYVFMSSGQNGSPVRPIVQSPPQVDVEQVLVASQDLPMGSVVNDGATSWQTWPKAAISEFMITKSDNADALNDVKGSMTRLLSFAANRCGMTSW